jgi:ubiquinone/menaquinone biosynthesis C-methylase UbiE
MQSTSRQEAEETWDVIAESFDTTRRAPWKQCLEFIQTLRKSDVVADLGCGNGRHLLLCTEPCRHVIGVDISQKLLQIVHKKIQERNILNASLLHADIVHLPLSNDSVDAVLCIASLHNVKGKEHRRAALDEISRVLKPNGRALISVWSRWQEKYRRYFLKQYLYHRKEFGDIDIYWKQQNLNIPRFYHLYSKREFVKELHHAQFQIEDVTSVKIHSQRFADNYFAVVRKR